MIADMLEKTFPAFEDVTAEEFALWKRHPCTVELQQSLVLAMLAQISDDLPESIDRSVPLVHQQQGARKTIELVLSFEPANLRAEI